MLAHAVDYLTTTPEAFFAFQLGRFVVLTTQPEPRQGDERPHHDQGRGHAEDHSNHPAKHHPGDEQDEHRQEDLGSEARLGIAPCHATTLANLGG